MAYYDEEEVIGSAYKYHRPWCHIIKNIRPKNEKLLSSWKSAADLGLTPCGVCNPYFAPTPESEESNPSSTLTAATATAGTLGDTRRELIKLLSSLDAGNGKQEGEGIAGRISRLARAGVIPREIAACMRLVTEMRNAAEYEGKSLSVVESAAVEASWAAVAEWSNESLKAEVGTTGGDK